MDNIKVNNHWEDIEDVYIRENGKWMEVGSEFIKVGGHWLDASTLSSNTFTYDGTIAREADGAAYLVNADDPTKFKAPLYSGNSIHLIGTNKITLPSGTCYTYDVTAKAFVDKTVELKDGTFGAVVSLDSTTFTQADLDKLTANPELLLAWDEGNQSGLSITKGAKDKVYFDLTRLQHTGTLKNTPSRYGPQLIKKDGSAIGRVIGGSITLPMVDNKLQKFMLNRCVTELKGDVTQYTRTLCPAVEKDKFKLKVRIANDGDTFQVGTLSSGTYDFSVDWGDGSSDTITAWDAPDRIHTYSTAGDYQISISGTMTVIDFHNVTPDETKLLEINNVGATGLISLANFAHTQSLN